MRVKILRGWAREEGSTAGDHQDPQATERLSGIREIRPAGWSKLAEFFSTLLEVESNLGVGVAEMFANPHLLLVLAQ